MAIILSKLNNLRVEMKEARQAIRSITKLSNRIRRSFDGFASRTIFSGAEGRTLHFLIANSDIEVFQKDIEEEFGIRPSTATVLLKKMEADGLITRTATDYDGRLKRIEVTGKGLEYRKQVVKELDELEAALLKDIDKDDLEVFLRVISKMDDNIK